ncbi:hypothetical protein J1605_006655 [Eschrichtius robustus]|uniref:Uncharacterized protein n=1 Tax=Eschrichtius robustus TaxID=9764 RepID=A0AB34H5W8_ESCRO|nr:hypothetical protein J1605_006655 [Eschrichtius robustus]
MSTSTSPAAMLLRRLRRLSGGSTAVQLFILTVVTFGLLAALACHWLLNFYFYLWHWHLNRMNQEFLQQSLREGEAALRCQLRPSLYSVVPASQFCTPAVPFPARVARQTLTYLSQVYCHKGFAKNMALYSLLRAKGERAYVVEPNLVKHIRLFSSLQYNFHPSLL